MYLPKHEISTSRCVHVLPSIAMYGGRGWTDLLIFLSWSPWYLALSYSCLNKYVPNVHVDKSFIGIVPYRGASSYKLWRDVTCNVSNMRSRKGGRTYPTVLNFLCMTPCWWLPFALFGFILLYLYTHGHYLFQELKKVCVGRGAGLWRLMSLSHHNPSFLFLIQIMSCLDCANLFLLFRIDFWLFL